MRSWLAPVLACAIVASAGVLDPAEAELAIDLYGGPSCTQSADLRASGRDDTGNFVDATLQDIRTNTGMTFGLRNAGQARIPSTTLPVLGFCRYTFFPDYQVKNRNVTYEADVNTHHIVFGVSLRF